MRTYSSSVHYTKRIVDNGVRACVYMVLYITVYTGTHLHNSRKKWQTARKCNTHISGQNIFSMSFLDSLHWVFLSKWNCARIEKKKWKKILNNNSRWRIFHWNISIETECEVAFKTTPQRHTKSINHHTTSVYIYSMYMCMSTPRML